MNMRSIIPWARDNAMLNTRSSDEPSSFLTLHRQMNRLFDDFFRDFDAPLLRNGAMSGRPHVEIDEGDKAVKVIAELPGLDERDIDITLRGSMLTLKGEKKLENSGSVYSERWHGQFARSIELGAQVDPDKVKATFNNGVLTITLEKRPEAQRQVKKISLTRTD